MPAFFITSSGTGVGKTLVTAALAHQLRATSKSVLALKPVVSGYDAADENSDTALLLKAQGLAATTENIERISPFRFAAPLSPNVAAKREGRVLAFADIVEHSRMAMGEHTLLIEGVGGVMAPLDDTHTVLDWMGALGSPAVLVVGSYLGAISHALTAFAAMQQKSIPIAGVVVSQSLEEPMPLEETVATLRGFMPKIPLVALPRVRGFEHCPDLVGLCKNSSI